MGFVGVKSHSTCRNTDDANEPVLATESLREESVLHTMSRWAFLFQVLFLLVSVDASLLDVPWRKRAGLAVVSFETSRETNPNSSPWRQKQPGNAPLNVGLDNGLEAVMV